MTTPQSVETQREDLRLGDKILYVGFDGKEHIGEVVIYDGRLMLKNAGTGNTGYATLSTTEKVLSTHHGEPCEPVPMHRARGAHEDMHPESTPSIALACIFGSTLFAAAAHNWIAMINAIAALVWCMAAFNYES